MENLDRDGFEYEYEYNEFRFFDPEDQVWLDVPVKIGRVYLGLDLSSYPVADHEFVTVNEAANFLEPFLRHPITGKTYRTVKQWVKALRDRDVFVDVDRGNRSYGLMLDPGISSISSTRLYNRIFLNLHLPTYDRDDFQYCRGSFSLEVTMPAIDHAAISDAFTVMPELYVRFLAKHAPHNDGELKMEVIGSGNYFNQYEDMPDISSLWERIPQEQIRHTYELPEMVEYRARAVREEWVDVRWMVQLNPRQRRKLGEVPAEWETVIGPADEPHVHLIRAPFHPASFDLDDWLMWVKFLEPVTGPRLIHEKTIAEVVELEQRRGFLYPPFPPRSDTASSPRSS